MALGKRQTEQQEVLFVTAAELPKSPGHVFYRKLNALLAEGGFDAWVEQRCAEYYAVAGGQAFRRAPHRPHVLDASHRHEMAAHLTMTPKYGVKARLEAR
ncbi:MAG: hypothetical protein WD872_11950 [Pirellulaceae bacterium]